MRHTFDMDATATCAELTLAYHPPYDWAAFLRFVRPRAIPGLERVDEDSYQRRGVTVRKHAESDRLVARGEAAHKSQVRFFFDLDTNPAQISAHLSKSRLLKRIVGKHPGLRVPRCWDPFELAVRAMLGQQVTVKGASTLAGRLVERFGMPQATVLADADLAVIGLPKTRAETMRGFARAVCDQRIRFDGTVSSPEMITCLPLSASRCATSTRLGPMKFPSSTPITSLRQSIRSMIPAASFTATLCMRESP